MRNRLFKYNIQQQLTHMMILFFFILLILCLVTCSDSYEYNRIASNGKIPPSYNEATHPSETTLIDKFHKDEIEDTSPITDKEFLFVSTKDGYIHAYDGQDKRKEMWSLYLGKELVTTNIFSKTIIDETNVLIPMDGKIFILTNNGEINFEEFDVPLPKLIERSPFTLPFIPNYFFIGEKRTTMYTVDVDKGLVVSKYSSGETEQLFHSRPVQTDNLMTVIRIDYTLMCLQIESGVPSWNVTVSEVMVIQKGSKSELTIKARGNDKANSIEELLNSSELKRNSIVSVHKYNQDSHLPVRIYSKPKHNTLDDYLSEEENGECEIGRTQKDQTEYELIQEYLKLKRQAKWNFYGRGWVNIVLLKIWEMYNYDQKFQNIIFMLGILMMMMVSLGVLMNILFKNNSKNSKQKQMKRDINEAIENTNENVDNNNNSNALVPFNNLQRANKPPQYSKTSSPQFTSYNSTQQNFFLSQIDLKGIEKDEIDQKITVEVSSYKENDGKYTLAINSVIQKTYEPTKEVEETHEKIQQMSKISHDQFYITRMDSKKVRASSDQDWERVGDCSGNNRNEININSNDNVSFEDLTLKSRKSRSKDAFKGKKKQIIFYAEKNKTGGKNNLSALPRDCSDSCDNSRSHRNKSHTHASRNSIPKIIPTENNTTENENENEIPVPRDQLNADDINNLTITHSKNEILHPNFDPPIQKHKLSTDEQTPENSTSNFKHQLDAPLKPKLKHKAIVPVADADQGGFMLKINPSYLDEGRLDKTFDEIHKIGQGGFGCVFKALHKIDKSFWAIKLIELKVPQSQNLREHPVVKEVLTMTKINHKKVVRYVTSWFDISLGSVANMIDQSEMGSEAYSRSKSLSMSKSYSLMNKKGKGKVCAKPLVSQSVKLLEIKEYDEQLNESNNNNNNKNVMNFEESNEGDNGIIFEVKKEEDFEDSGVLFVGEEEKKEAGVVEDEPQEDSRDSRDREEKALSDISYEDIHEERIHVPEIKDDSFIKSKTSNRISQLSESLQYKVYFFIQMEYCDGLPLNQFIELNKDRGMDRKLIFSFFKQMAKGVKIIHKNNIIHRDIKPQNIFVNGENKIKIGDFGLATEINISNDKKSWANLSLCSTLNNQSQTDSVKLSEMVGTPLYLSPEQIENKRYNEKVDIFALGLILFEMCGCFKTGMERRENIDNLRNSHTINPKISQENRLESELILWMTNRRPSQRPSAKEIFDSNIYKEWMSTIT